MTLDWFRRLLHAGSADVPEFRRRYASFRRLLARNSELLALFADLEADLGTKAPFDTAIRERILRILALSLELVQDLNELTGGREDALFAAHHRIETAVRSELDAAAAGPARRLAVRLDDPEALDPDQVGGKAARLGEIRGILPDLVPPGFVATTASYRLLAREIGLPDRQRALLAAALVDEAALAGEALSLRRRMEGARLPGAIAAAIREGADRQPEGRRVGVRSSAVGEDGPLSFAGQFETRLGVPRDGLASAYLAVVASGYSDRALAYRRGAGLSGFETPMAVLFLPMVTARASGVLYTRDPQDPAGNSMLFTGAFGLGADVVGGTANADLFVLSRRPPGEILERRVARKCSELVEEPDLPGVVRRAIPERHRETAALEDGDIERLARVGLDIERHFGCAQDIEWAMDEGGRLVVLQARPLRLPHRAARAHPGMPLPAKLRGRPLSPGRAVGPVFLAPNPAQAGEAPEGSVLVVRQATPELARALGRVAGLVAETGSPLSHAAALVRQAEVPAVYDARDALTLLAAGEVVGVDGNRGEVYSGTPWPGFRNRRRRPPAERRPPGFPWDRILRLDLIDPSDAAFRAEGCSSIHDLVRVVHERSLDAMFRLGDRYATGGGRAARHLASGIPLDLEVLDLGGGVSDPPGRRGRLSPESMTCIPFRALWKGIADPRVTWAGRREVSPAGFLSVVAGSLGSRDRGMRRLGDRNYLIVALDYLNLNARMAYHYAMIDAVVGEVTESNYVSFRFQGGGAARERRDLRARFIEAVLGANGFTVDRRGDLVNAWLRTVPRQDCEQGLLRLGLLLACARQLDMNLGDAGDVKECAERFLAEDFARFA